MVGSGGLEPPASCSSDRRSNQVSYEPAEGGGPDPQRVTPSMCGERRNRILCPRGHDPASNRSRRACPVHSPCVPSPGFEPATFDLASRRSNQLSYIHLEPPRGIAALVPADALTVVPLPLGHQDCEPQRGFEPRTPPLRGACSGQLSYRGMAAGQRLELQFTAPEAAVLPFRRPGIGWLRAPPGARTLFPRLRIRCITSHACSAWPG
jgi:hypothetical protein